MCSMLSGKEKPSQSSLENWTKNHMNAFLVAAQMFSFEKMDSQTDDLVQQCFIEAQRLQLEMKAARLATTEKRSMDEE